jgi:hypothetical protein
VQGTLNHTFYFIGDYMMTYIDDGTQIPTRPKTEYNVPVAYLVVGFLTIIVSALMILSK